MVDVDGDQGIEHLGIGETRLLGAVDGDQDPVGPVGRQLAQQAVVEQPEKPVLARQGRRPGEHHDAVLPELEQREVHGEQRSECVAVGILV